MLDLVDDALSLKSRRFVEVHHRKFSIVGDIHGDFESLKRILKMASRPVIFLGDYGDRGERQVEVYREILRGYLDGEFILLRGNHETTTAFPHDFPEHLRQFDDWEEVYRKIREFWESLPWFAVINDVIFAVHGGIYTRGCRIADEGVEFGDLLKNGAFVELVWNDPWEKMECDHNFERGIGYYFGIRATERFLKDLGLRVVVRSHQPYKILKVEQNGMVVTVGSTGVYGGGGVAFLNVDGDVRDGFDAVRKYGHII